MSNSQPARKSPGLHTALDKAILAIGNLNRKRKSTPVVKLENEDSPERQPDEELRAHGVFHFDTYGCKPCFELRPKFRTRMLFNESFNAPLCVLLIK